VHAPVDARELVEREEHARADCAFAHRERIEHAHFHVRMRGEAGQQRILARGLQVVHQQPHACAARRSVAQFAHELPS
jgi:hypothetical protein